MNVCTPLIISEKNITFNLPEQISDFNFVVPQTKKTFESYDVNAVPLLDTLRAQLKSLEMPTNVTSENKK